MSIFEAIRDQVSLDRLLSADGSGKTRCVAPGHDDNDPSMHLYGDHVHCFSCGFHGDVTDVWAAMHGFGRPIEAALEWPGSSASSYRRRAPRHARRRKSGARRKSCI